MSIEEHLSFLELPYKKKEKIPIDFLIVEIDVDSFFFIIFWTSLLYKIELSDLVTVSSEKPTQSKSLLLIHKLRIKDLNLRLNYTSQGKKFCLFSRI